MAQTALITGASRGIGRENRPAARPAGNTHRRSLPRAKGESGSARPMPASVGRGCVILSGRRCRPGTGNEHDA